MIIDTKKTSKTPKDQWEAIDFMNEAQQRLVEALHIMDSVLENNTDDFKELHEKRIKDFIKQFEA
jgi:hypothetical protein